MRKGMGPRIALATRTNWRAFCSVSPPDSRPIDMKSITSPMPASLKNRVISTLVFGRYICLTGHSPSTARENDPPF